MCLGNSLEYHRGRKFSAHDKDNDEKEEYECAEVHMGGWWYYGDSTSTVCFHSNLNGVYKYPPFDGADAAADGIAWLTFHDDKRYSMKYADMKLRPT